VPTAPRYVPRRPQDTALHRLVREHLATFLEHARTTYAAPLPRYVVEAFERYLACGDFSRGFVRCHCDACRHDVLVAFSCKGRGVCPSCAGRRMCNEAACITDRILPNVPVRQWVLSVPFDLRAVVATKPDVRTAVGRIFAEEIARAKKRLANVDGAETGVVSSLIFPSFAWITLAAENDPAKLAVPGDKAREHERSYRLRVICRVLRCQADGDQQRSL
jgi:hypothetical protein